MLRKVSILAVIAAGLSCPQVSSAAFVLIDDFESGYTVGSGINGINGWTATSNYTAQTDPSDSANVVVRFGASNSTDAAYKALPANIGASDTGTLFARFRFESATTNGNFGVSDVDNPSGDYQNFNAQLNIQPANPLQARDGSSFEPLRPSGSATQTIGTPQVWYNLWVVVNNADDTYRVFVQSDGDSDFATQTEVFGNGNASASDPLNFRRTTAAAIDRLMLRSQTGNLYWDDFYIDAAATNLANPIPEPTTVLLALAGLLVLPRQRRNR